MTTIPAQIQLLILALLLEVFKLFWRPDPDVRPLCVDKCRCDFT